MKTNLITIVGGLIAALLFTSCASGPGGAKGHSVAASASKIRSESASALNQLYSTDPKAQQLAQRAKAVLVFPEVVKGGFVAGGAFGRGALFENGQVTEYYQATAGILMKELEFHFEPGVPGGCRSGKVEGPKLTKGGSIAGKEFPRSL